jgi:arylsulfatase A
MGEHIIPGGKGKLTDFGTHVPMIVNWPGKTPAGKMCSDLIDFSDFMPTLAELAGAELPDDRPIDGHSFVGQIIGQQGHPRKWIYNQFEGQAWIRTHRWKLYTDGRLFDMTGDPLEKLPLLPEMDDRESGMARKELGQYLHDLKGE